MQAVNSLPNVIYRYDNESERTLFENAFRNDFNIVALNNDADAEEFLKTSEQSVTAIILDQETSLSTLPKRAQAIVPSIQIIILHQDMALNALVDLLESGSVSRCFEKPYDPNLLRSEVYMHALGITPSTRVATDQQKPHQKYKALVVDDEVIATKFLQKQLVRLDCPCDILVANDAEQALELVQAQPDQIAMIISDQRMPGMKGNQLLSEIQKINPDIVRMLTSAYEEVDIALSAVNESKIFRYIKKPWQAQDMNDLIRLSLHEFETRMAKRAKEQSDLMGSMGRILDQRESQLRASLIDTRLSEGTLNRFFTILCSVEALPPNQGALRASIDGDIEETLINDFSLATKAKLAKIAKHVTHEKNQPIEQNDQKAFFALLTNLVSLEGLSSLAERIEQSNFIDAIDSELDLHPLVHMFLDQLQLLLSSSGLNPSDIETTENGFLLIKLKMFRHLLSPQAQIMPQLINQQSSLLVLLQLAEMLQLKVETEGRKHALIVRLNLSEHQKPEVADHACD